MGKKILIVDDDEQIALLLASRLKANKYEVVVAYDGLQAVTLAFNEKPDLIILDIMLPKTDGYNVCKMLRSNIENTSS